jgi:hypothetical protein
MKRLKTSAFILACLVIGTNFSGCSRSDGSPGATAASEPKAFTADHLSAEKVFQAAYNSTNGSAKHTLNSNQKASLWFSKELTVAAKDIFVVFVQVQELTASGDVENCHICTASIQAITFTKTEKGWPSAAELQRNVTNAGAWGRAPTNTNIEILKFSVVNVVLLVPDSDGGQGITNHALLLLNFNSLQSKWKDVGTLNIGANNQGERECVNAESHSCYSYSSTLTSQKGDSKMYPDLLVTKNGTDFDLESNSIVSAKSEIYRFNGVRYLSEKQEQFMKTQDQAKALVTTPTSRTNWYTFDVNHSSCFQTTSSPADRIRMIQDAGFRVQTKDLTNGAVEVGDDSTYWTYFKNMETCTASLPRSQPIPSKYE